MPKAKKVTTIEFEVIKANIADEEGNKVLVGETVELGKKMAAHYRDLGYIKMPLPYFGDDEDEEPVTTPDADAGGEPDDGGAADGAGTVPTEPTEGATAAAGAKSEKAAGAKSTSKRRRL